MGERGLGFKLACKAETDSAMKEAPKVQASSGGGACIPQTNMKSAQQDCRVYATFWQIQTFLQLTSPAMLTVLDLVLDAFGGASGPRDEDVLVGYAHTLSASAPLELKDLEQTARALNLYTNVGDAEGQAQACDALCERVRAGVGGLAGRAVIDQGTLPSIIVILQGGREEPCRAAAALLSEICSAGGEQRRAVVRSGALRPLVPLLRKSHEPRLLREGARVLAALAAEPLALTPLLREGAPRALKHLCRSQALQAHADAVVALGRLARADASLLGEGGLPRVFCSVASGSVLEARAAAAAELRLLLMRPTRRAAMLAAGCVSVLLRCCDSMNETLKLSALHGLALLLSGAGLAHAELTAASPIECLAEEAAAAEARVLATQQLELSGLQILVGLAHDSTVGRVVEGVMRLLELLSRDTLNQPFLEQASAPECD